MSIDTVPDGSLKLCLIYAPEDQKLSALVEKRLKLLERQGLIASWSIGDILAGSDPAQVLESQLAASDLIVCLLSLNFADHYPKLTLGSVMERYQQGKVCIIPVLLKDVDMELLDPPFTQLKPLPESGRPLEQWKSRDVAIVDILRGIRRMAKAFKVRLLGSSLVQGRESVAQMPVIPFWNVPYRQNPWFTGRKELLTELHACLHRSESAAPPILALTGLGGVGKTQVAVEYAYLYGREYRAVLWVRADTSENLASDGLSLARTLKLSLQDSPEQEHVLAALRRWFGQQAGWLLVLDNVENLQTVADFLPVQYHGHVLVTTRSQVTRSLAEAFPIPALGLEEGTSLLLRSAKILGPDASYEKLEPHVWQKAQEIAQMFSGLPLALDQAGAYLEETGISLDEYIRYYEKRRADLLAYRGRLSEAHPASVSATLSLAIEQVEQAYQPAAELLRLCSFLHPALIPRSLLSDETSNLPLLPGIADAYELDVALGILTGFSLVHRHPATRTLSVHRLVQAVLRDTMQEQEQRVWAERVIALVSRAWPEPVFANWPRCQEYLPHALACANLLAQWPVYSEVGVRLLTDVARYLSVRASYSEAERLLLQALALSEAQPDTDDVATARILHELGWIAHCRRQDVQAEDYYQRALIMRENKLGPDDIQTAQTLQKLGLLRVNRRAYTAAGPFLQRALAIREQRLGANHPEIAETLNALAMLARGLQNYALAEEHYQRALALYEQAFGPDTPEVATCVFNIATLLFSQKKYEQAESLYRRALEIRERVLGSEHPQTASTLDGLATDLRLQDKYTEAEPLSKRALTIQELILGREHPETAQSLLTLGMIKFHLGAYQEAETLCQQALEIRERLLSSNDPNLVTSMSNLALVYQAQKKYEQACSLFQRALDLSIRVHGAEHASTLRIRHHLANLQNF
jgi:tetratricopeptide (TPR) repeat protein